MPRFVPDLRRKEKDGLGKMRVDAGDPFGWNVERRVLVLGEKRHELADGAFQLFVQRAQRAPGNISRSVPVSCRCLFVELRCALAPRLISIEDIKREIRTSSFNRSAARGESVGRFGSFSNLRSVAQKPIARIESSIFDAGALSPIELAIDEHSKHGSFFDPV